MAFSTRRNEVMVMSQKGRGCDAMYVALQWSLMKRNGMGKEHMVSSTEEMKMLGTEREQQAWG